MKKIVYIKAIKDNTSNIPVLTVTNFRKGKRIVLDLQKIQSRKYWTRIYNKFGYRVRSNHIKLDHRLICLIFDVPANRIHRKLALRLFNAWKNNSFSSQQSLLQYTRSHQGASLVFNEAIRIEKQRNIRDCLIINYYEFKEGKS